MSGSLETGIQKGFTRFTLFLYTRIPVLNCISLIFSNMVLKADNIVRIGTRFSHIRVYTLQVRTTRVSIYSLLNEWIMSYIDNEILERLIGTMVEGFARIEKKLDQMNRLKECMNGDRLLDNVDLAELLGVSQRTLARYRKEGKIKYYSVEKNGKSFYLASEIQEFLLLRGKRT